MATFAGYSSFSRQLDAAGAMMSDVAMSFSFTISPADNVSFAALDAALRAEFGSALSWEGEPPEPWPLDHYAHAYLWGVSTRSVELGRLDEGLQIRIMSCSCSEDYELALRTVEIVARMTGGEIESEYGETCDIGTLRLAFDQGWVDQMVESGATILPRMLEGGRVQGPLTLPGPERDFVFGARVMAELGEVDDTYPERLFTKIREVRYFDDDAYFAANVMQVTPPGGEPATIAVWGPGVKYLFPNVKYLVVSAETPLFVPAAAVWELAGAACRALDDAQVLVEAIDDQDWDDLVKRAQALSVEP